MATDWWGNSDRCARFQQTSFAAHLAQITEIYCWHAHLLVVERSHQIPYGCYAHILRALMSFAASYLFCSERDVLDNSPVLSSTIVCFSNHRGAKRLRRYELLGVISLFILLLLALLEDIGVALLHRNTDLCLSRQAI